MEEVWFQSILEQLSPNFTQFVQNTIKGRVEPAIQGELQRSGQDGSSGLGNLFQVVELDLGNVKPSVTNLSTHKSQTEERAISIDFDVDYTGDCSIQVRALGIPSGVRDLTLRGRGRIILKPKMSQPPFFGGIQFCLLDDLEIDFDLEGLTDVCDTWSFVRRKIRNAIVKDARKAIVYPNKIYVPTSSSEDPMIVRCLDPTGIMAVKVNSGSGLPTKGGLRSLVGQGKPDTYVKVRAGAYKHVTSVVKNCVDPVWEDSKWAFFLMETCKGHRVSLTAFDEDSLSKDDFLGKAWITVEEAAASGEELEMSLNLEDCPRENPEGKNPVSGELTVATKWMPLSFTADGATLAVLTLFVYSCNTLVSSQTQSGIPEEVSVSVSVTNQPTKSTETEKNSQHPTFNDGFSYLIEDLDSIADTVVTFDVIEGQSTTVGSLQIALSDFMEIPIKRKLYPIGEDERATMTVSAEIKFA